MRRRKPEEKECLFCGRKFKTTNRGQKYCCDSCRVLAYMERKRNGQVIIRHKIGNAVKTAENAQKIDLIQEQQPSPLQNFVEKASLGQLVVGGSLYCIADYLLSGGNNKKRK